MTFIKIGDTRIKKSNIKNYGISIETTSTIKKEPGSFLGFALGVIGLGLATETEEKTSKRYLYITTYQNDNYKFYENDTDIDSIITLLDSE